jgi:urease accessory protein
LGRHRERSGAHSSRLDVTLDDLPLLRHELRVDDPETYGGGAVLAGAGAVGSVALAGPDLTKEPFADDLLAVLPLAAQGVLVTATGANATVLRRRLDAGEAKATGTLEGHPL